MPGFPIVVTGAATAAAGSTRVTLRNRLADELGFYLATSVTAASNGEAARVALADELRDDESAYAFLGKWVYVRNGAQQDTQRRILSDTETGYQGSSSAVVLSRPFAAALATGTLVEITAPLPSKRSGAIKGLNECINEALGMIRFAVRLTLTGSGTYQQDLSAYPWLTGIDQTRGIYDTVNAVGGVPPALSAYGYEIVTNGTARTLVTEFPYTSADTFYLDAVARADRYVYDGTSWAFVGQNATPGLLNDAYQTAAPEHWVLAFAMVTALRQVQKMVLADRTLEPTEKRLLIGETVERRRYWNRNAKRIMLTEFPPPLQRPTTPLIVAPARSAWN